MLHTIVSLPLIPNWHSMIRIGTRESKLALWQADTVCNLLQNNGVPGVLVPIKSEGDINLQTPLYAMGVQGIFTKALDAALLAGQIDIAVHSMKDVPTRLAQGLCIGAVLERGSAADVFVPKNAMDFDAAMQAACVVASSSVRRRAQWLRRFPHHSMGPIRGNVQTRLRHVAEGPIDGAIFAQAGLERLGMLPAYAVPLPWMLPAPAQGAIVVVCRQDDAVAFQYLQKLNHLPTALAVAEERSFLQHLMGGCTAPVGALCTIQGGSATFAGNVLSVDGKQALEIQRHVPVEQLPGLGAQLARELLQQGAEALIGTVRNIQ